MALSCSHMRCTLFGASLDDIEIEPSIMFDSSEIYMWYPSLLAARTAMAAWALKKPVKLVVSEKREKQHLPCVQGIVLHLTTQWSKIFHHNRS